MKKLILITSILATLLTPELSTARAPATQSVQKNNPKSSSFTSYPSNLQDAVKRIEQIPEAMSLLEKVQKEGPIRIELISYETMDFEALWNSETRTIILNNKKQRSLGDTICSILFELHNASTDKYLNSIFNMASQGKIEKNDYVARIEKMEHSNALNTCALIKKGVERGIFPPDTVWNIYEDFDSHYMIQQLFGHSQWLADNFDYLAPINRRVRYKGTLSNWESITEKDRKDYLRYITIKNKLVSQSPEERQLAKNELAKELENIQNCENGITGVNCTRYRERKKLMENIFNS